MADLSLDLNPASLTYKDLLVVSGDLILTSDAEAGGNNPVLQDVIQRLSMFLGEWFLDNTQGTPWFQQILVKNPNDGDIDGLLKNILMGTPGVEGIVSMSFQPNFAHRTLSIQFALLTTSGTVNYNGILAPVYAGGQTTGTLNP